MPETIALNDMNDWDQFATANKDALLEMYQSLDAACMAARQGGIQIGGGSSPEFFVVFVH